MKYLALSLCSILLCLSCASDSTGGEENAHDLAKARIDVHSYAQPEKATSTHLSLDLVADFESKTLSGSVEHTILSHDANEIIFDMKDITIDRIEADGSETTYEIKGDDAMKGQALHVAITPETKKVKIYYKTSPSAEAIQWLSKAQTTDKKYPFLFTQGQAILTRTWIPCQDSPGIRVTYDAKMTVPSDLMAVMSATNPTQRSSDGVYTFEMKQAIPPYLIALAIGDLSYKAIGPRTGVYAEKSMLEKSAYEFADLEKMVEAAENLYGPYLWDVYDIIVLPSSFPFGGMENPRLTFATPTIIAGDRSLTSLVAHELAHSWSGNLVTNATWDDFWMNEGFTVYFENRIMEAVYGADYTNMLRLLGRQDLEAEVADMHEHKADTHLKLNLKGRNPDDGMTSIAYEKGALFLMMLEEKVGRDKFDAFLKAYFDSHKFKTITTEEFVVYLKKHLLEPNQLDVNINEWIYGPGIPDNAPSVASDRFSNVEKEIANFAKDGTIAQEITSKWSAHEWMHFIRHLPKDWTDEQFSLLDNIYGFSKSGNSEIAAAWYEYAIRSGHSDQVLPYLENFLVNVGRRKFLTPLYRALKETDQLDVARKIYKKARSNYHSVSANTMDALLEI